MLGATLLFNLLRFLRLLIYVCLLCRPNIVEIHLAVLLYTFLQAGLLEAIVEVIVSSDTFICVRASVLLGNFLLFFIFKLFVVLWPACSPMYPVALFLSFAQAHVHIHA